MHLGWTRRSFLNSSASAVSALVLNAYGQNNLLRLVVASTPGSTPDTIARVLSPVMQERLSMSVLVDNRPGASGMIGMRYVSMTNDASTLLIVPATTVTLPFFYKQIEFDVMNGFTPITQAVSSSFVLCVHKNIPINDLNDFTSWVRANPTAFYASPGKGTHHHLFMEKLLQHLNITLEHVPYKGAASAVNDLIAGQIPIMFLPIQVAVPMRDDARLRIVGGSLKERHPSFLDIPSLHELGATNYHADPWFSIWGSPKLSSQQADKYRAGIVDALNSTAIKESLNKQGLIVKTSTGPELQNKNRMESEMWAKVISLAHIRPE